MLDHTDPVASIIPAMSIDSPSDNAMAALYRLALGPVNTDDYLTVFERFDSTGRTTTTWNWAACLATLNWMLFRQLWSAALVYVAAAEGLALIVFGMGRSFLQWPQGVELGVLGAFALLAFAVPGLYGNAILYGDIRKRVARALAASRTVPEACALLEKQASSRKRLKVLVLANLALGAAALLAYLALSPSSTKPLALEPAITVAQASAASAAKAGEAAPEPERPATSTESPAQSAPASTPVPPPVAAAAVPPDEPAPPAPEPPAKKAPQTTASHPATKTKIPAKAAVAADARAPAVGTAAGYYINVGLFAEEANARKTQARLLNEGLPAFRQELNNAKGRRIRVRVGPYNTRAKADAAAQSIRAMDLDAVVFKQP
ncbi:SPOR domain-containing protein [Acidovorax sp.]|uniref:SPOR domain-containing protein n=1 Tax=Acidovorax sp. TaxID=1872122 RepID=UPI002618DF1E|nr:SPOR domain-containing protein [Acidovorax sp.]